MINAFVAVKDSSLCSSPGGDGGLPSVGNDASAGGFACIERVPRTALHLREAGDVMQVLVTACIHFADDEAQVL